MISGQPPAPGKSSITGSVVVAADGKPVENCRDAVMLAGCTGQMGASRTDSKGTYSFRNIPPRDYVPAVRISKSSFFLTQEQKKGEYLPKAIKYSVGPNETLEIAEIRLEQTPDQWAEPPVKLIYPVGSETIKERSTQKYN